MSAGLTDRLSGMTGKWRWSMPPLRRLAAKGTAGVAAGAENSTDAPPVGCVRRNAGSLKRGA